MVETQIRGRRNHEPFEGDTVTGRRNENSRGYWMPIPIPDCDQTSPSRPPQRDRRGPHPRYIQPKCQLRKELGGFEEWGGEVSSHLVTFRCHRRSWRMRILAARTAVGTKRDAASSLAPPCLPGIWVCVTAGQIGGGRTWGGERRTRAEGRERSAKERYLTAGKGSVCGRGQFSKLPRRLHG
jgi:hypothetical protein